MHAHWSIGRVGELALALGAGVTIALGGCAVAAASPLDSSSEPGTVDAAPTTGRSAAAHSRPRVEARGSSANRVVRPSSASSVSGRAATAVALPSLPQSPIEAIGNAVIASASVLTRSQSIAPAAAVTTGQTASRSAAATADVNPIAAMFFNQTPTLSPAVNPSAGRVVTGQLNGYDPDSAPLSYTVVTSPANGSVSIDAAGNYTYTPYSSTDRVAYTDSFTVSVSDADTGFHIHGLMGLLNMLTFGLLGQAGHTSRQTVSVSVPSGNVAPAVSLVVRDPDPVTGLVAGAVFGADADADPLTYTASVATYGSVNLNQDGSFTYTPTVQARHDAFFSIGPAADAFTIDVSDGYGGVTAVPVSVGIAGAGITFAFDSYDSGWTQDAIDAMNAASRSLASYFLVNAPTTITLDAISDDSDPNNLAYASADFANGPNGFYYTVPQAKVITRTDANALTADAVISFNWSQPWNFGDSVPSGPTSLGGEYDFKAVAIHELLHAVGFLSGAQTPLRSDRTWTVYDSFLVDYNNRQVISPSTLAINGGLVADFTDPSATGGLYFRGANAGTVRLYTPSTWSQGSSVSHVNQLPNYVMNPSSTTGNGTRRLNTVEVGILKDIGYHVSNTWVSAFVILFVRIRRRRR